MVATLKTYSEETVAYKYQFPPKDVLHARLTQHVTVDPVGKRLSPLIQNTNVIEKASSLFANAYLPSGDLSIQGLGILKEVFPQTLANIKMSAAFALAVALEDCASNNEFKFPSQDQIIQKLREILETDEMLKLGQSLYPNFFTQGYIERLSKNFANRKVTVSDISIEATSLFEHVYDEDENHETHRQMSLIISYGMRQCGTLVIKDHTTIPSTVLME